MIRIERQVKERGGKRPLLPRRVWKAEWLAVALAGSSACTGSETYLHEPVYGLMVCIVAV